MTDLGQVFTKKSVAQFMISLCEIRPDDYILDPCFGAGVFIEELYKKGYIIKYHQNMIIYIAVIF